ncbi:LCP family protein [Propionimicrobium sp. PCR01-08-3]|uniref:LCP family protein n=1 Tax=Propionimicrobium sp. PCR01-08-3 TaxID=3052086 RepID=UPI00255C3342|nr:LCP family protein [Propionimicrobium sp. PCR01-08-3]WIY82990.1 LCP family protein [Propionimicrobium sp. PCR01-08-3]
MTDEPLPPDDESPETSEPGKSPKHERRRNRRLLFGVLIVLLALLLGGAGIAIYYGSSTLSALNEVQRDPSMMPSGTRPPSVEPSGDAEAPINIVLMGSDTRGDEQGRSDVLQLLHISGDRQNVYLMSIPRDSYVSIPGHGMAKVNAAYSWGGAPLAVETMEGMLGVPMDHTAIIDFEGFVKVIDAVGGVTVYNKEASSTSSYDFPAGEITLTGDSALAYVRERYDLSGGDFSRAERQRDVIKAVLSKLTSTGVLTDPGKFKEAIGVLGTNFTVDSGLTNDAIFDLGWSMRDIRGDDINSFQLPTSGVSTTEDGQSIVLVDGDKLLELQKALRGDEMATFYESLG